MNPPRIRLPFAFESHNIYRLITAVSGDRANADIVSAKYWCLLNDVDCPGNVENRTRGCDAVVHPVSLLEGCHLAERLSAVIRTFTTALGVPRSWHRISITIPMMQIPFCECHCVQTIQDRFVAIVAVRASSLKSFTSSCRRPPSTTKSFNSPSPGPTVCCEHREISGNSVRRRCIRERDIIRLAGVHCERDGRHARR